LIVSTLPDVRKNAALLIYAGNMLTVTGCLGLAIASLGFIPADLFAFGLSSGIRMIATVAIAGCLLSAIGYGLQDYFNC
jgi:hypothetical protein